MADNMRRLVTDITTRIFREDGFLGEVEVLRYRRTKTGFTATVLATKGGITATYKARYSRGFITYKRVETDAEILKQRT